jgi:hypothetical protein
MPLTQEKTPMQTTTTNLCQFHAEDHAAQWAERNGPRQVPGFSEETPAKPMRPLRLP